MSAGKNIMPGKMLCREKLCPRGSTNVKLAWEKCLPGKMMCREQCSAGKNYARGVKMPFFPAEHFYPQGTLKGQMMPGQIVPGQMIAGDK